MASSDRLVGTELIDCARANGKEGIEVAAKLCGYGNDIAGFELEFQRAAQSLNLHLSSFYDLVKMPQTHEREIEIAPESSTQF